MQDHPARKKIINFVQRNPEATVREIMKATGLSSTSQVDYHLTKLMAAGRLKKINQWEVMDDQ